MQDAELKAAWRGHYAGVPARLLSGGSRRRLAIAQSFVRVSFQLLTLHLNSIFLLIFCGIFCLNFYRALLRFGLRLFRLRRRFWLGV